MSKSLGNVIDPRMVIEGGSKNQSKSPLRRRYSPPLGREHGLFG